MCKENDILYLEINIECESGLDKITINEQEEYYCKGKKELVFDRKAEEGEQINFKIKLKGVENEEKYSLVATDKPNIIITNDDKILDGISKKVEIVYPEGDNLINYYSKNGGKTWEIYSGSFEINPNDKICIAAKSEFEENKTIQPIPLYSVAIAESILDATENIIEESGYYKIMVDEEQYYIHAYVKEEDTVIEQDTAYGDAYDIETINYGVGTITNEAKNMIILKVKGNLTIEEGKTLSAYGTEERGSPKGLLVYASGKIANNGTISMTGNGAKAEGQNVYLWKNSIAGQDNNGIGGEYEYIPRLGAEGANSNATPIGTYQIVNPNISGAEGVGRKLAGGASGGAGEVGAGAVGRGGKGGQATSYSGGGGGGGTATRDWTMAPYNASLYIGGKGHITTENNFLGTAYDGRTVGGGLLIVYASNIEIGENGVFESAGKSVNGSSWAYKVPNADKEYRAGGAGGGSGGGSINIFYKDGITGSEASKFKVIAESYSPAGTYNVGSIATGTYVPLDIQ